MKGMVLAAGMGSRLRPYTDSLPKALVPVDGETTILDIGLANLAAVGLSEVVVVVGYRADTIEQRRADLEQRYGVAITLVHNDRAMDWNNCYSLWLTREHFADGVLLVNGDTVHPVSVERTLLDAHGREGSAGVVLAVDTEKQLAHEEMKVTADGSGALARITKLMDPAEAYGEYIGATLIQPAVATALGEALEDTWRRDPGLYYEDGYQTFVDGGGTVGLAPIGTVSWVEVDDHVDLARAREIACHY